MAGRGGLLGDAEGMSVGKSFLVHLSHRVTFLAMGV